ncbi:hypothetical protein EV14_3084 [Prochlorococcus sp. MIT 0703]|nr:hypothetical protein EV12_0892 [Prochlorococcus sp. MIT 0701]KGG30548.1 hypothetical protein EV14_3084 [Prochlorococcus sp. MIT 0703]
MHNLFANFQDQKNRLPAHNYLQMLFWLYGFVKRIGMIFQYHS